MKITRSYLLGVGSGFMLSVLFAISLSAIGIQDFAQLSNFVGLSKLTSSAIAQPSKQIQPMTQDNTLSQPSQGSTLRAPDSKGLGSVPNNPTVSSTSNQIISPSIPVTPSTPNPKEPSIVKGATQTLERQFVIPNGVSSERVAELLIGQGYITDRTKFLELVDKRGLSGKFQTGTYNLLTGLSDDEVLNRLMGKR